MCVCIGQQISDTNLKVCKFTQSKNEKKLSIYRQHVQKKKNRHKIRQDKYRKKKKCEEKKGTCAMNNRIE